jgi:hypothetical protein
MNKVLSECFKSLRNGLGLVAMSEHKENGQLRFIFVQDKPCKIVLIFGFVFSEANFIPPINEARNQKQI